MDQARRRAMIDALRQARALLALPDNDFSWSSFIDAEGALREVDGLIDAIEQGRPVSQFAGTILFAPTGPIQEVSLSSGWGDEFIAVADRWDAALALADDPPAAAAAECRCLTPPLDYRDYDPHDIGVDEARGRFAEVRIDRCRTCGREWLHYAYEIEGFSGSGRWYRGLVTPEQVGRATPQTALGMLAELPWHLYGGSYFGTTGRRCDVPLDPATA
jgi:hypothetical protein